MAKPANFNKIHPLEALLQAGLEGFGLLNTMARHPEVIIARQEKGAWSDYR